MKLYTESRLILGRRIKRLRLKLGLSQEELAFQSNLDTSYLGGVERGVRNPSFRALCMISDALKVGLSPLVRNLPTDAD